METECLSPSVSTTLHQNVQQFNHPLFMKQKAVPFSLRVELITLSGLRHVLALSPGELLSASELFLIFTQFRYNNGKLECSFNFCKTEQHRSSVNQLDCNAFSPPKRDGEGALKEGLVGGCRQGLHTGPVKTKAVHFATLFKTFSWSFSVHDPHSFRLVSRTNCFFYFETVHFQSSTLFKVSSGSKTHPGLRR